ncbi:GntR family transcriptional regulator [Haloferula chungangensis]|uniref:GntR family transcriptional regulator n=1 Tax=Haloferula chungangensis TaxID=1048331 RepID=A0ABW2L6S7_9BACT
MKEPQPKYLRVHKEIRRQIHNQQYLPGDLLPTEAELCARYEASRPTIARALKLLTDEKLVHRKAGFGTQVLAPRKTGLLAGLLIPQLSETEIFEPICSSIAEAAGIEGMRVIRPSELNFGDDLRKHTESLTSQLISARVRGVFFAPAEHVDDPTEFNLEIIERLSGAGIQVVLLDRDIHRWPRQTPFDLIGIDNIEAGYVVATHLLDGGCRRLAFVTRGNPAMTVQLRRMGCREALIQHGRQPGELMSVEDGQGDLGKVAKELLEQGVDGVICANDATASLLLRNLLDRGAKVPKEIKVCGFDDVKYASLVSVPLTSYQQPCFDIGRTAAGAMIHRIKHPDAPVQRIALQGQLVVRESSSSEGEAQAPR